MAIITRDERLLSPSRFLNLVLISFISEKFLSTDAVPTGIDRQISDKVFRFGNQHFIRNKLC